MRLEEAIVYVIGNHSIFRLDTHVPQTYLCAITQ